MKQPLDVKCNRLTLAKVTINGDFGVIITKTAATPVGLDKNYFLLGNKTAQLIEEIRKLSISLNAAETRRQVRARSGLGKGGAEGVLYNKPKDLDPGSEDEGAMENKRVVNRKFLEKAELVSNREEPIEISVISAEEKSILADISPAEFANAQNYQYY